MIEPIVSCQKFTISCLSDYAIVIRTAKYGVKHDSSITGCSRNPRDCYGSHRNLETQCAGKQKCDVSFTAQQTTVSECSKNKADYIFVEYQCVPVRLPASVTPTNELCNGPTEFTLATGTSMLVQSKNYPNFSPKTECKTRITAEPGNKLLVYLNLASFPILIGT